MDQNFSPETNRNDKEPDINELIPTNRGGERLRSLEAWHFIPIGVITGTVYGVGNIIFKDDGGLVSVVVKTISAMPKPPFFP